VETVTIDTPSGRLRGERLDDADVFRAIPYAAPPVGQRRFRPPAPAEGWTGERDALSFGASAPQLTGTLEAYFGGRAAEQSEDCLTLNVWAPRGEGPHPVLVWIHGGAFVTGAAATPWYSGRPFARSGCVLVSINYRLGALGFTHLADHDGERFAASGNLGLLDQIAALQWVSDNIAAFGGDAGNVTIFGESAGGASVVALLATPAASGLFHRAIAQSPSITQLRSRERAREAADELLSALRLDPTDIGGLVDVPLDQLIAAQAELIKNPAKGFTAFAPTPDGVVLLSRPSEALADGAAGGVPVLLGTTRDEMHLFTFADPAYATMDDAALQARAERVFDGDAAAAIAAYRAARPGYAPGQLASAIATDQTFRVPADRAAEALAATGSPVWSYWFTYPSPVFDGLLGACHGLEIPFVFGNLHQRGVQLFTGDGDDRLPIGAEMHDAWVAFARDGDPGWPRWDRTRRATRVFGPPGGVVADPEPELRSLWSAVR
jgi:para-nitrobenzyl esterase